MRPWRPIRFSPRFHSPANDLTGAWYISRPPFPIRPYFFLPSRSVLREWCFGHHHAIIFLRGQAFSVVHSLLVAQQDKLLERILHGASDANIGFEDLCQLLQRLGFDERTRGSHHVFRKQGVQELINLQRDGNKAKVYQVRQVRSVLLKYGLGGMSDA